jgi:hypothetical protein
MSDIKQIRKGVEIRQFRTLRQAVEKYVPGDEIFSSQENITPLVNKLYNQKLDKFKSYNIKQ